MRDVGSRRRFVIHAFASLAASTSAGCRRHETAPRTPAPLRSTPSSVSEPMPRAPDPPAMPASVDAGIVSARVDAATVASIDASAGGGSRMGSAEGTIGLSTIGTMRGTGEEYYPGGPGLGRSYGRLGTGPLVRAGLPTVSGLLAREVIRRVVLRNLGQVAHCHEQGLAQNPNAEGRIVIRFIIGGNGDVLGSMVADATYPIASVGACVAGAVRRWHFPPPEGGGIATVNYPFDLRRPG